MKMTKCIGLGIRRVAATFFVAAAVVASAAGVTAAQGSEAKIAAIRALVARVDNQIMESESNGEYSSIFRNELVLNQVENPWPAVGIYQKTVRFYYTYGNREVDPYPSRLLKITVATKRSDRREDAEYVFDPTGRLVFVRTLNSDNSATVADESRFYLTAGRVVAATSGSRELNLRAAATIESSRAVVNESKKLIAIFNNSLE